jgi:nitrite reductase (NO-forming)
MTARNLLLTTVATAALALGGISITTAVHADDAAAANIIRAATEVPAPLGDRAPKTVQVELETIELVGQLDDGTTYRYWTFDGKVPGPMVRVKVGDTVEVRMRNHEDSWFPHNVDFHAVTGLHGGGHATYADPGEDSMGFTFKALNPGLYVYHCAVPLAAQHIANGMYGMILVEPAEGLPEVDREFYVMQGEIYTEEAFGSRGELMESYEKLMNEMPEYYVFNGAANALHGDKALRAEVGETIRIYFGVGGPNKTSSFHVIGEIFDTVYNLGSITADPLTDVQTISVPPGGAAIVDFKVEVPGEYLLVDHALSRAARGLVGKLYVDGPEQPDIYREGVSEQLGMIAE